MNRNDLKPVLEQFMAGLEVLMDMAAERAVARYIEQQLESEPAPGWVEGPEAVAIMGAGYPLARLKAMGHAGEITMDRKDPDKENSPYIWLRSSLLAYTHRRAFEIDQSKQRERIR